MFYLIDDKGSDFAQYLGCFLGGVSLLDRGWNIWAGGVFGKKIQRNPLETAYIDKILTPVCLENLKRRKLRKTLACTCGRPIFSMALSK